MQGQNPNVPGGPTCPPQTLLGWLASFFGLNAPAYRGVARPTGSGGYRPPRPRAPASCHGADVTTQPPIQFGSPGEPHPEQPLILDGPVTIIIGSRE